MTSYITADDQRKIRSELAEIDAILQTILTRLTPLEKHDERVIRTQEVIAALQRLLWAMTSGPGRLGPAVKIEAILDSFLSSGALRVSDRHRNRTAFPLRDQPVNAGIRMANGDRSANG
jgi:hypothetical protein